MKRLLFVASLSIAFIGPCAFAQEAVTDQTLKGTWLVDNSKFQESFSFSANNEFVYSYVTSKKDGKDIPPTVKKLQGAYTLSQSACSANQKQGNLWIVKDSDRCCFKAYAIGKALVLDDLNPSSLGGFGVCSNKTLRH